MFSHWSFRSFAALSVCFFLNGATSLELKPVTLYGAHFGKRAANSALQLQSTETFLWGAATGSTDAVLANFTMSTPGADENVLSLEKFSGMLKSVDCSNGLVKLTFKDATDFTFAKNNWDWVNRAESHKFVFVAGAGECGWNVHRQPFSVTKLVYDDSKDTATLTAVPTDWITVAHTYDLQVGHISTNPGPIQARDLTKDISLDMAHTFPFSFAIEINGLKSTLECSDCNVHGKMNMEFRITTSNAIPNGASMKVTPAGVGATAKLKFSESGKLNSGFTKKQNVLSVPLDGITIPGGILKLGPTLDVDIGFEAAKFEATASITGGADVSIPDSSILNLDLLTPSKNSFSGWAPTIQAIPITVDAKVEGGFQAFVETGLDLSLEALHHGYELGLKLKMPSIDAKFEVFASSEGACKTEHHFGVKISSSLGAELSIEASNVAASKPFMNVALAAVTDPLAEKCFPFGPNNSGTSSLPAPTSSPPSPTRAQHKPTHKPTHHRPKHHPSATKKHPHPPPAPTTTPGSSPTLIARERRGRLLPRGEMVKAH